MGEPMTDARAGPEICMWAHAMQVLLGFIVALIQWAGVLNPNALQGSQYVGNLAYLLLKEI